MPSEPTTETPSRSPAATRVLSGIQPTGRFHWGNYFGAIRQYIELQSAGDAYYFIADLHALTTVRDPARLRGLVHDAAVDLVALGLDPTRATLFVQSDVPEVTELTWLLMTVCPMGLLERCHAYKDKKSRGLPADAGLFTPRTHALLLDGADALARVRAHIAASGRAARFLGTGLLGEAARAAATIPRVDAGVRAPALPPAPRQCTPGASVTVDAPAGVRVRVYGAPATLPHAGRWDLVITASDPRGVASRAVTLVCAP
jgi:hypothetical protein